MFKGKKGFTLLELMIVIAIVGILATLAQPMFKTAVLKSKEAALKEDLFNLRNVLDQYYADNGKYPDSLHDLVDKGYMRGIPSDPFTGSSDTWRLEYFTGDSSSGGDSSDSGGIYDVHSGSDVTGLNGKSYSEW
ncbi:MAG: prepilin-type N-terminal cleavage/methylation domain-containing protein [Nitrospirota bacterium]